MGSLIGGQMYQRLGGTTTFKIFSLFAICVFLCHMFFRTNVIDSKTSTDDVDGRGQYTEV